MDIASLVQTGDDATIIQAVEMIGNDAIVLGSIPVTGKGTYRISFKPTGSSVQLWVLGAYDILLKPTCYTYPVTTQETYLVDICDENKDRYRFGFNGQEKVNELAGIGNHNTAEFWEYDTRTVRRWNVDPVVKEYESSYLVLGGNPIWASDVLGNDSAKANNSGDHQYKKVPEELKDELPGFPNSERLKHKNGARPSWNLGKGWHGEWDSKRGEIEVYNKKGKHQGAADPWTGKYRPDSQEPGRQPTYKSIALDKMKSKYPDYELDLSPLKYRPQIKVTKAQPQRVKEESFWDRSLKSLSRTNPVQSPVFNGGFAPEPGTVMTKEAGQAAGVMLILIMTEGAGAPALVPYIPVLAR